MRTGNVIVDAMANVNISGNIISPMWYRTVVKEDGKPHLLAISILSDIVYWYRPRIIRDEVTGNVIKAVKRFSDDFLQRSSKALAEQFGVSKRQITEALKLLEQLKVINRHFRVIERKYGDELVKIANVQYIELNVDMLLRLSELPNGDTENDPVYDNLPEGETQNNPTPGTNLPDPPTQKRGTNTEITAETTTEITYTHNARACEDKPQNTLQPIPFTPPAELDRQRRSAENGKPPLKPEEEKIALEWFGRFWKAYPKKQGQVEARLAWMRMRFDVQLYTEIVEAVQSFRAVRRDWQTAGGRYVPMPANFLMNERWKDEVAIKPPMDFDKPMDIASMAAMIVAEGEKQNADREGYYGRAGNMERGGAYAPEGSEPGRIPDDDTVDVKPVWSA